MLISGNIIRITPTYVGRIRCSRRWLPGRQDHPHVCGENLSFPALSGQLLGSPPRMWGEFSYLKNGGYSPRITPTYVGRIVCQSRARRCKRDHPHVCGENRYHLAMNANALGSPPRMWGEFLPSISNAVHSRITPTYVGRICNPCAECGLPRDHPHVCGENPSLLMPILWCPGSPPRMWGESIGKLLDEKVCGITPTYVGRIQGAWLRERTEKDHPHVCGENLISTCCFGVIRGSPPRMWGESQRHGIITVRIGITPTYVGRITELIMSHSLTTDHPHVCGENSVVFRAMLIHLGSPPRMWGEFCHAQRQDRRRGITPTYVGRIMRRQRSQAR